VTAADTKYVRFSGGSRQIARCLLALMGLWGPLELHGQQTLNDTPAVTAVPRLVRISNTFHPANGMPAAPVESVTLFVYREETGGTPLWQETQNVNVDAEGHYTVLMGSTLNDGVPLDLFNSAESRWLGVQFNRSGETEQSRVRLASVPYALKASDAETLGGRPASAYLLAPSAASPDATASAGANASPLISSNKSVKPHVAVGTQNYLSMFTDSSNDLGNSLVYQNGTNVGIGTTNPLISLDVRTNALPQLGMAGTTDYLTFFASDTYGPAIYWDPNKDMRFGKGGPGLFNPYGFVEQMRIQSSTGNVGIGTKTPGFTLDVAGTINGNNSSGTGNGVQGTSNNPNGAGVNGFNTATTGYPVGVQGNVTGSVGAGVSGNASQAGAVAVGGYNSATSGFAVGVVGGTASNNGAGVSGNASHAGAAGVLGSNSATSGFAPGVQAGTNSPNGPAIAGNNNATSSGGGAGVGGFTGQPGNFGVAGYNNATSGDNGAGVTGVADAAGNAGVSGFNNATSGYAVGVQGSTASNGGAGVQGNAGPGAFAVSGFNGGTSGYGVGTQGNSSSPQGIGVLAVDWACGTSACTLVPGTAAQLQTATTGTLLQGLSGSAGANTGTATQVFRIDGLGDANLSGWLQANSSVAGTAGVQGNNSATSGNADGVFGATNSPNGSGVSGVNNASSGAGGAGVFGATSTNGLYGVVGFHNASSGYAVGVEGASASSSGGIGVWGVNMACGNSGCTLVPGTAAQLQTATTGVLLQGSSAAAGDSTGSATQVFLIDGHGNMTLAGNLSVGGTLSKSSGSFRIDHPLDPDNKYLYHSFVESPDMKNIYDGIVVLDENGEATVTLPDWFEALNQDFRYQLTCIGGYAPVYVASEVSGNQFHVAGGRPGLKVSWQLTGIRHDAYANAHRIPVEELKPASERGTPAANLSSALHQ
jgi:trimeric autotransporter adhesin